MIRIVKNENIYEVYDVLEEYVIVGTIEKAQDSDKLHYYATLDLGFSKEELKQLVDFIEGLENDPTTTQQ